MKKNANNKSIFGMTMAEMLIVIAILGVLFAVAFIGVARYQRSLAQLERDNTAKELFIAAQNHLTMARGEKYYGIGKNADLSEGMTDTIRLELETELGYKPTGSTDENGDRYIIVNSGSVYGNAGYGNENGGIFEVMLPFGSIDETVRAGGSYIIRYNRASGTIKDVFFWTSNGSPARFNHTWTNGDFNAIPSDNSIFELAGAENKSSRRDMSINGWSGSVLGWYGGDGLNANAAVLQAPRITVTNKDLLYVKINDLVGAGTGIVRLIVTGETSKANRYFTVDTAGTGINEDNVHFNNVSNECVIVLDDITFNSEPTKDRRFKTLFSGADGTKKGALKGVFKPGENLIIKAVAFNNSNLATVSYSNEITTNSLFASVEPEDVTGTSENVAHITSIRHLENLDPGLSSRNEEDLHNAIQTNDLSWTDFKDNIKRVRELMGNTIIDGEEKKAPINIGDATVNTYLPVNPSPDNKVQFSYDGKGHSIKDVEITQNDTESSTKGNAGLFNDVSNGSIQNIELIDFAVAGTGNAGALAGNLVGTKVTNVVAHNSIDEEGKESIPDYSYTVSSSGGNAGGLIGDYSAVAGNANAITYCAASLMVQGNTAAGGLMGKSTNVEIGNCYSGGHTENGEYYRYSGENRYEIYNVDANSTDGVAGGLVGNAGNSVISQSYSTCSVKGSIGNTGGFTGSSSGSVTDCYATGLVSGSDDPEKSQFNNAFFGDNKPNDTSILNCYYFEIVNEVIDDTTISYRGAGSERIKAIDSDTLIKTRNANDSTYDDFVGSITNWENAIPYDQSLETYYGGHYNLKTVTQMGGSEKTKSNNTYFVSRHYGDWPAPEIFFINTPNS